MLVAGWVGDQQGVGQILKGGVAPNGIRYPLQPYPYVASCIAGRREAGAIVRPALFGLGAGGNRARGSVQLTVSRLMRPASGDSARRRLSGPQGIVVRTLRKNSHMEELPHVVDS